MGISSDGDPRLLSAMKSNMNIGLSPLSEEELNIIIINDTIYIQDTTHIGTKMRNRLLKPSVSLPFGTKAISISHLKLLLKLSPKDQHGLVQSDICPNDRQNYKSLQKVMELRVTDALKKNVIDSEATIVYISICRNVTSSFLDGKLTPLDRIYRIWHSVFILRIWRNFIIQSKNYSLAENFISPNAHACIEVNAIGLIQLIVVLRNNGSPEMFIPYIFDSQPCERTFRQMRSMGTMNWTKINFTIMELLHMIERVELQNDIIYDKLAGTVNFPRVKIDQNKYTVHQLPQNSDIVEMVGMALKDAKHICNKFGMSFEETVTECPLRTTHPRTGQHRNQNEEDVSPDDLEDLVDECLDESTLDRPLNLRHNVINDNTSIGENSKFIQICDEDGTIKNVLKSSIVWLLSDQTKKLSNDRLKRVQAIPLQKISKRQKIEHDFNNQGIDVLKKDEIMIGEWCVFSHDSSTVDGIVDECVKDILIGSVYSFRYVEGRTQKDKQYHLDYAPVKPNLEQNEEENLPNIEVLSNWYLLRNDGTLITLNCNCIFFINIKNYLATTEMPNKNVVNSNETILKLSENVKDCLITFLQEE